MVNDFATVKARLEGMLSELDQEDARTQADRATVALDQQAIGRLSRMDALQNQQMANAQHRRREQARSRIRAALARMDSEEYSYCIACGAEIEQARLDLDPAIPNCIECSRA